MTRTGALLLAFAMTSSPGLATSGGHALAGGTALTNQNTSIDGIAAVVNGEVVTLGEVHRAALLRRAFGDGVPASGCDVPAGGAAEAPDTVRGSASASEAPDTAGVPALASGPPDTPAGLPVTPATEELAAALECLIDSRLVFREVRRFPQLTLSEDDIEAQYTALADSFGGESAFEAELQRQALTPAGVRRDLRRQHLVATYIDSRFRATIDIGEDGISSYYDEELVPDLTGQGIEVPPLEDVADLFIVPILREREVNRRVQSWISDLRERATIQRRMP